MVRVLVTGAGGQTGSIIVRKLLERASSSADIKVRALVRSAESEAKLKGDLDAGIVGALEVAHGDITKAETLAPAFKDVNVLIIASSAMPRIDKASLVGVIFTKLFTFGMVAKKPSFWFDEGQNPEIVDYFGQCSQIDQAKKDGVQHIVLLSSMGGTKPDHFLNTNLDNIVLWKRKAECHLMSTGLSYTIIHPGGLLPHPGARGVALGGKRQLHTALDDELVDPPPDKPKLSLIPREDVAEVCVQCALSPGDAKNRSFDLGSGDETDEVHEVDLKKILAPLNGKNCTYHPNDAKFSAKSNNPSRSCSHCGA